MVRLLGNFSSSLKIQPNFFEIELSSKEIELYGCEYSDDLFKECVNEKDDYFYYRDGRFLYALPSKDGLERPLGFELTKIEVNDSPYLVARLLANLFKIFFESKGRRVYHLKYSSESTFDINSEEPSKIGLLSLVPTCKYSVKPLVGDNNVTFVMTLSKEYKPRFEQSLEAYKQNGIDTRDWQFKNDFIVASRANIKKYLDRSKLQTKYDSLEERLRDKSKELAFIVNTIKYLNKNVDEISSVFSIFNKFNYLTLPNTLFEQSKISKPTNFYYNHRTTRGFINTAVQQLKPLSYDVFSGQKISICTFIPNTEAKQCERLIANLEQNLSSIFHLDNVEITNLYVGKDRREHIKHISQFENKQYDLALFFLFQKDKNQSAENSAYNRLKAKLISKQIPSQSMLVENARRNNEYHVRNLALNIYSKIGGTPWAIEKEGFEYSEFVIGVGSTIDDKKTRNIGFASVFDHHGAYMVGSCSPLCKLDDYRDNLKGYLTSTLNEIIDSRGITKGDKIRLIFHIFKDASRKYEISAIKQCLEEFVEYEIEYAILSVSFDHPYKFFVDENQQLERGTFVKLTSDRALLCMGGRGSKPLQIKLDSRSTYQDIYELTKQVLYFSHLSHKSFMPAMKPVTTTYPHKLAQLTSDLLKINHWDPDMLHGMRDKLWFI